MIDGPIDLPLPAHSSLLPEKMAELAGMTKTEYDKIIQQGKVTEALKEFGPITGPADMEKFKARYPGLITDSGAWSPKPAITKYSSLTSWISSLLGRYTR